MKKTKNIIGQLFLNLFFIIFSMAIVLPFVILVSISLSNEGDIVEYGYSILPKHIDFAAYKYVFKNSKSILNGYKVTIFYSVIATVLSVLIQSMCAYPLSKRKLRGKRGISFYLYFTMLFSGGMVPTYILITQYLHLGDTIWVYIIPSLVSPWNVFMMRTFFSGLPYEIFESMKVDGASEYNIFFKTVLPLSKPVLATIALLTFLGKWGDWNTSMLYINNESLYSLQYLLQRILQNMDLLKQMQGFSQATSAVEVPSETVRMAMAVIVAGPALVIFPFFQKYFVKGLTVGAVKG